VVAFSSGAALTPDRLWTRVWSGGGRSATAGDHCYSPSGELPAERCRDLVAMVMEEGRLSEALTDGGTLARLAAPSGGTIAGHGK
jgi:hypothetical protein